MKQQYNKKHQQFRQTLLIKRGGIQLYELLVELFNYSWKYSVLPDEWNRVNVVAQYKGAGKRAGATSYRPISVTSDGK